MNSKKPENTACKSIQTAVIALFAMICVVSLSLAGEYSRSQKSVAVECAEANEKMPEILITCETSETTSEMTSQISFVEATSETTTQNSFVDMGEFEITAYCPCSDCCGIWADGFVDLRLSNAFITDYQSQLFAQLPQVMSECQYWLNLKRCNYMR